LFTSVFYFDIIIPYYQLYVNLPVASIGLDYSDMPTGLLYGATSNY